MCGNPHEPATLQITGPGRGGEQHHCGSFHPGDLSDPSCDLKSTHARHPAVEQDERHAPSICKNVADQGKGHVSTLSGQGNHSPPPGELKKNSTIRRIVVNNNYLHVPEQHRQC